MSEGSLPKCVTRMYTNWLPARCALTMESSPSQGGTPTNPSSLHASSFPMVPGHPECIETTVSGPPGVSVPHVLMCSVPLQIAVKPNHTSRLGPEAPQLALPSLDAKSRSCPVRCVPGATSVAPPQL